ncbi:MAG: C10 family peptidase [Bacteroides sp.]|nr:C10 family peptidase [Bacteroides sp.]
MKKLFFCATLVTLTFVACSNEEDWSIEMNSQKVVQSKTRSIEEAAQIAQNAIGMLTDAETRSIGDRCIDFGNVKFVTTASTRNGEKDTLLYVFNYTNNNGFAVVSANKTTEPLLAVTEQGTYDSTTANENNGFNLFMDMAEQYVSTTSTELEPIPDDGTEDFMQIKIVSDTVNEVKVAPKLCVQWGQTGYEGAFAPNGIAGCGNVAATQVMSYYCHPTQLNITFSGAPTSLLTLDWNAIKLHPIEHSNLICFATDEAHTAIGLLHREIGELNYSTYNTNSTSTYISNVRNTFIQLGYTTSSITNYSNENFYSQLSNNKLLYMGGSATVGGHAWVVDGCHKFTVNQVEWIKENSNSKWEVSEVYDPVNVEYLHINWGWDGSCNGYFYVGVFSTDRAISYDNRDTFVNNNVAYDFDTNLRYFEISK